MGLSRKLANLGSAIDSGQTSEFLTIDDSGGLFREVQYSEIANRPTTLDSSAAIGLIDSSYIQARQVDVGLDSALITQLVDSSYVQARTSSTGLDSSQAINLIDSAYLSTKITVGLDSSGVTNLVDSSYVAARASTGSGFDTFQYTATANQTTFEDSDVNGEILSYTADGVLVFYNGILLDDTVEYTASTGTSVVLSEPADSGATLLISKWSLGSSGSGASSFAWGGDRGLFGGGQVSSTDVNTIEYIDITSAGNASDFGDLTEVRQIPAACSSSSRGVFGGGEGNFSAKNVLDYVTIATTGNAQDFGDLTVSEKDHPKASSNGTIGLFGAGNYVNNRIDSITIATTGNATDFGDLSVARDETNGSAGDATYSLWFGGYNSSSSIIDTIDYMTYASSGNAQDFGDLTVSGRRGGAASDTTRAVCFSGVSRQNTIDYVTIATTGNASDFGDSLGVGANNGTSNGTRAVFSGNTSISFITIQTTGNYTDFGDLGANRILSAACAGSPS